MNRAVYIDRDGTINEDMGNMNNLDRFNLLPRSAAAIKLINENKLKAVVVTNQSGIALGFFSVAFLNVVHEKMVRELSIHGAAVDAIYYCPHSPHGVHDEYRVQCACRKPQPGMLEQAAKEMGIDNSNSFVVGDKLVDIELAKKAGARGILVLTGYGKGEHTHRMPNSDVRPDYIADDLYTAVIWVLEQVKKEG